MEVCGAIPKTWFVRQQPQRGSEDAGLRWLPLRRCDQQRLEAALLASEVGLGSVPSVPVDGGRAEARIAERLLVDRYGTVPPPQPSPLRRVLWLRGEGNGKNETSWQPYSEKVDAMIEDMYHRLVGDAETSMATMMPTSHFERSVNLPESSAVVHLELNLTLDSSPTSGAASRPTWNMTAEEQHWVASETWLGQNRSVARKVPVKRGYGEVPLSLGEAEEEALDEEISQLFVLVHSAGHEPQSSDVRSCVRTFRRNMHRSQLWDAGLVQMDGHWKSLNGDMVCRPPKVEVLDVSWEQGTQTGEATSELKTRLERLTLATMPRAREITNCAAAGALLYARHREEILSAAGDAIAAALWRFEDCHPSFAGDVLLVGHSLGGVALFDLLRGGRLSSQARSLFTLGSPIGLLLDATEDSSPSALAFPGGTRLFNVFHPLDPMAYRVEPLLAPELGRKPAAKVPGRTRQDHEEDRGKLQNLQVFLGWPWNEEGEDPNTPVPDGFARARGPDMKLNGRVDWVLQEGLRVDEVAGDAPSQALSSHTGYLKSVDVAFFIHDSVSALVSSSENDQPPPEMPLVTLGENLGQVISKRWEESGAKANVTNAVDRLSNASRGVASNVSKRFEESGAKDIVKGSMAAAWGVAGTARALYGTARLVGSGVAAARGATGSVTSFAERLTSPLPSPKTSPMNSPRPR